MKTHTNRDATPEEAAAILSAMQRRHSVAEEIKASLLKHITPEMFAASLASLPADAKERIRKQFAPRPTIYRTKITKRRKTP